MNAPPPGPLLPCRPPLWARGGHAQTLLGHLLPSRAPALCPGEGGVERVEVALEDGDRLVVLARGEGPVVLHLFHGLSGDANSDYMRRAAALCARRGWAVASVNHRGCGSGVGLSRRPYHAGRAHDLAAVLRAGRQRWPAARHVALGFSLSGAMLLNLLADGGPDLPDAALAVNPPADLAAAARCLHRGLGRLYEVRFVRRLKRAVRERERRGLASARRRLPRSGGLYAFDDAYTAPEAGFEGADEYYARCSPLGRLESIATPTVVLTAADDPLVPAAPLAAVPRSQAVQLHVEGAGGHLGYLCAEKTLLGTRRWLDYALDHFLTRLVAG